MKQLDFSKYGGFPLTQNGLDFLQKSFSEPLLAMAKLLGDKVIVDGINIGATSVSDGWFVYGGEVIKFNACPLINNAKVNITQPLQSVLFQDGLTKAVYKEKQGVLDANVGSFFFNEFVRLENYLALQTKVSDLVAKQWLPYEVKEFDCTPQFIIDNIDSSGLGKNLLLGGAVCNGQNGTRNRQGRTSIGMYYPQQLSNPNDNVWDILYNTIGATVGKNKHGLTADENGEHDHVIETGGDQYGDDNPNGYIQGRNNDDGRIELRHLTQKSGQGLPHENRQPSIVTLFIQRII